MCLDFYHLTDACPYQNCTTDGSHFQRFVNRQKAQAFLNMVCEHDGGSATAIASTHKTSLQMHAAHTNKLLALAQMTKHMDTGKLACAECEKPENSQPEQGAQELCFAGDCGDGTGKFCWSIGEAATADFTRC